MWARRNGDQVFSFGNEQRGHIIARTKRAMKGLSGNGFNQALIELKKMEARQR